MRLFFFITSICLLLSCSINKNIKTAKYSVDNKGHKLVLQIPRGYAFTHVGWESLYDGYEYQDSTILYVTDGYDAAINDNNIKDADLTSKLFNAKMERDTITLNGVDKKGLYWRYTVLGLYGIGYRDVPKVKKALFDKVIDSARIK